MNEGVIFSDESGWDNDNRYGAICTISGTRLNLLELHKELELLIKSNNRNEIGFKKVKGSASLKLAKEFIDIGINYINNKKIKAHILVWDKQDKRHSIQNRCDVENLKRMYYKILKEVQNDWKYINNWSFYPDELTLVDWEDDIIKYIKSTKLFNNSELFSTVYKFNFPNYKNTKEKSSRAMYNIQLADLFAGIIRTSRNKSKELSHHLNSKSKNLNLFEDGVLNLSKNLIPKLDLLHHFKNKCSANSLGVNFSKNNYFDTFNKKNNIIIWHYYPKSEFDKAPTRKK